MELYDSYTVVNPAYSDWEFSIIYELEISRAAYSGDFGSVLVTGLRPSPNNLPRGFRVEGEPGELIDLLATSGVPEPATAMLTLLGLAGGVLRRQRS